MRASATLIALALFALAGCGVEPSQGFNMQAELNKVKGPETGSIEATLKSQAEQAVNAGDFRRAAEMYKQLTDKSPDNTDYALAYGDCLRRAGANDAALKVIGSVLKKEPSNAQALETNGLILMNMGEFADAGKNFGEVMKTDSHRWRTLNGIGILFAMKSMHKEALAYYDAALTQSPDNASVLNNKGLTLAMDGQYDAAVDVFDRARRHLPNGSPDIKNLDLNLALVYAIAGKLDMAEQTAAPHLDQASLYNNMGFYAYLAKNNELAKGYLDMALTHSPVYYERAWRNIAAINGATNNPEEGSDAMPEHSLQVTPRQGLTPPAVGGYSSDSSNVEMVPPVVSKASPSVGTPLSDIPQPAQ